VQALTNRIGIAADTTQDSQRLGVRKGFDEDAEAPPAVSPNRVVRRRDHAAAETVTSTPTASAIKYDLRRLIPSHSPLKIMARTAVDIGRPETTIC
jgi:hypothetical protein|tara:strand:- start:9069 stop:9356 length:288 start_codon:yes stop_codon:yes gene_type:complete